MLPALLQAASEPPLPGEDDVAQNEEAYDRGYNHGDYLRHVPRQVGGHIGVDEDGADEREEQPVAHGYVHQSLQGKEHPLPRVAALRPAPEGPASVPQVAVEVR